jgi:rubrerythrin
MGRQALLDKLSEFLVVEQGGLQIYRVAAARARDPELRAACEAFGRQTARHRDALVRLIRRLGGDPDHVSATARLAQAKATALLETSRLAGPLSPEEVEANDLENILLAETKDHANWHVLRMLARATGDLDVRLALEEAVGAIEAEEDYHLGWARDRLARATMRVLTLGPAPSPERWQRVLSGPAPSAGDVHPAPVSGAHLLGPARAAAWGPTPVSRETGVAGR